MIETPIILIELKEIFGPVVRTAKDGEEILVQCPYCVGRGRNTPDRTGHLGLNFAKNVAGCVRCGWGCLNLRKLLREKGYSGASGGDLRERLQSMRSALKTKLSPPPVDFLDQRAGHEGRWVPIRSAPSEYSASLIKKGLSLECQTRWKIQAAVSGPQEGYVIFPFTEFGEVVYWQGRAIWPHLPRKYSPPLEQGSSHWLYNYPDDIQETEGSKVVVLEGTLDCISVGEATRGHPDRFWPVSVQGTNISGPSPTRHVLNSHVGKIRSMKPKEVLLMLDPEELTKARSYVSLFTSLGMVTRVVRYPTGADPNKLFQLNPAKLLTYLTSPR